MIDESEKRYQEVLKRAQQEGLCQLHFIELYRLYCNANYYYEGDDLDDFRNKIETELLKRIGNAGNDEIVQMFASVDAERSNELFTFELFELIVKGGKYSTLDDSSLKALLDQRLLALYRILESENVVKKFDALIKTYLLSMDTGITFWIAKNTNEDRNIFCRNAPTMKSLL